MKTTRTRFRAIALVLAMATVFLTSSFTVIAEDSIAINPTESITDVTEEVNLNDPDEFIPAVYEVEDLREESVKHFSMPDGTYQAVSYSGAVHRKNADGSWRDIDNRLNAVTKNGFASYTTEDGRISFVQNTQSVDGGSMLYTLTEGNYMIAMGIMGTSSSGNIMADDNVILVSSGEVTNHAPKPEILVTDSAEEQLSKLRDIDNTTEILYEDILNDTDIEYVLTGNDVKENIIVKAKRDSYTYTFQMLVKGLEATANADGSITLSDETSGEAVYYIPAPYMYDANGEISYDVSYSLVEIINNVYTLAITADDTWIEADDRAFPVVIDPTVSTYIVYKDTYISQSTPNTVHGHESTMLVSSFGDFAFIEPNIPIIDVASSTVTEAELRVPYYLDTEYGSVEVGIYKINEYWTEDSATYANSHDIFDKDPDLQISSSVFTANGVNTAANPKYAEFDVTSAMDEGYHSEEPDCWMFTGFAFKCENTGASTPWGAYLVSDEGDGHTMLTVTYVTHVTPGVYSLRNSEYSKYITGNGYTSGTVITAGTYGENPAISAFVDRSALFKISCDDDGLYTIRSMRNNALGLGFSGNNLVLKALPENDNDVDENDKFHIQWSSGMGTNIGFTINPYGNTNAISMSSSTTFSMIDEGDGLRASKWHLTRYYGNAMKYIVTDNYNNSLFVGDTYDYNAYMYSTEIGQNGPISYSIINEDETATDIATINSSTGELLAREPGNIYLDTSCGGNDWVVRSSVAISVLPLSGSEIVYNPDMISLWNSSGAVTNNNCYNYALNTMYNSETGDYYFMQPGVLAGDSPSVLIYQGTSNGYPHYYVQLKSGIQIQSNAIADAAELGITFIPIGKNDVCPTGTYKIALVIDSIDDPFYENDSNYIFLNGVYSEIEIPDTDYHWYRQNSDGTWSHKRGGTEVINYDASGETIYDPQICNRDYGETDYSVFVGYYAVGFQIEEVNE